MNRDREEFDYLADLEDPNGDNFVPSDYNTQDMRNINEKVNRILYGENAKNNLYGNDVVNSAKEEQVDINLNSNRSNSSKEINSFSNPNKESDEGYIYDTYNNDKKQPKAEKPTD